MMSAGYLVLNKEPVNTASVDATSVVKNANLSNAPVIDVFKLAQENAKALRIAQEVAEVNLFNDEFSKLTVLFAQLRLIGAIKDPNVRKQAQDNFGFTDKELRNRQHVNMQKARAYYTNRYTKGDVFALRKKDGPYCASDGSSVIVIRTQLLMPRNINF
jgi:hypothetical protein